MHRGGGSLKPSHNQDFTLIEAFNNLALCGEKKFVSELKRAYKLQRGVNNRLDCHANACNEVKSHTEDNSPKYRMVGNDVGLESPTYSCNSHPELNSGSINLDKRLRNKCAMTSVGSYFRHWCGAFTLAEVLITLGIIGVVAAMTMPALIANTKKSEISAKLKKFNTTMAQCVLLSEQDNGPAEEWSNPGEYDTFDLDKFFKTYLAPYIKYSSAGLKTEYGSKRYYVYLLDGGYFYFVKGNCVDIVYDVNGSKKPNAHGRDIFRFLLCGSKSPEWCDGRHFCPMYSTSAHTREEKIQDCIKGDRGSGCTGLLEYDGWEFKKDYPIRL